MIAAVRDGDIDEAVIDRKRVHRILLLAARVGALGAFSAEAVAPTTEEDGFYSVARPPPPARRPRRAAAADLA